MTDRHRRRALGACGVALGSWILAAVFVRVSLDWSDGRPYEGTVTEVRYVIFACTALAIAATGTIVAFLIWRGRGRSKR
ncbi:hypothetical protein [Agromyces sp. SYSU T00194]|uniref:hypothetical protein n=1 Tax=Agromyces chitinivorans TaxID=3158560 RepID=UPI003393CE24